MTSPFFAGLGRGLSGLGQSIDERELRDKQAAILAAQIKRQEDQQAFENLLKVNAAGGTILPTGADPTQSLQGVTLSNNLRSGMNSEGTGPGAIPNSAMGIPDESTPNAFGSPSVQQAGGQSILLDPSRSPAALAERRQSLSLAAADRRSRQDNQAKSDLETQKETAKTVAGVNAARADYNTLKATNAKHPLVQSPFDADNAANYKAALTLEGQKQLQASAYHPEQRAKYGSFIDPKNPTAAPVFIPEDEASRQGFIPAQKAGGSGGGGQQQNMQARLLGAVSEGRLADQRMGQFEQNHLKNGHLDVSSLDQVMGSAATNLAASKSLTDIAAQGFAEGHMNAGDKADYLQYRRDARLISRAEQLMSARGGSEAMASDNAFLARGGANAPEATVRAAQKSRKALFGQLGAIMQTLTPDQAAKLAIGLDALAKDDGNFDYAGLGKEVLSSGAPTAPPGATTGAKPSYEDWKKSKGVP